MITYFVSSPACVINFLFTLSPSSITPSKINEWLINTINQLKKKDMSQMILLIVQLQPIAKYLQ